jgi:hypothetical protein
MHIAYYAKAEARRAKPLRSAAASDKECGSVPQKTAPVDIHIRISLLLCQF